MEKKQAELSGTLHCLDIPRAKRQDEELAAYAIHLCTMLNITNPLYPTPIKRRRTTASYTFSISLKAQDSDS